MCGLSGEQAHKISQRFLRRQIQFCCAFLADHEPVLGRCCSGYASTTHACYYFLMSHEIRPYRFRLPAGLSHFDSRFAKALKALRADRKETQQVVADAIGITRTAYARFANGKSWPRPDTFEALQDYFEVFGEQLAVARQPGERATGARGAKFRHTSGRRNSRHGPVSQEMSKDEEIYPATSRCMVRRICCATLTHRAW